MYLYLFIKNKKIAAMYIIYCTVNRPIARHPLTTNLNNKYVVYLKS